MKKYIYLPLIAISLASIACSKIETADNTVKQNTVEFHGIINSSDAQTVKTNYDLDESTGTFYWMGVEKIGVLNYYSSPQFWQDIFTSTTSADNKETALEFSGTPSYGGAYLTDYAFYPIWDNGTQTGIGWSSNPFKLFIPENKAYNAEAPLKDVVPMIAKKDGEGNFAFKPVTAIIEVNVKNLPADARKITLSSTEAALSGYYLLTSTPANYAGNIDYVINNGLTVTIAKNGGNTDGKKTITFESGLGKGEYSFYFPVSVGALPDLTISIKGGDDSVLQSVSYSKPITTTCGNIIRLPLMDLARATSVVLAGTVTAPTAYINRLSPDVVNIKYAVAASADDAKVAAASGVAVSATGSENAFSITPGADVPGLYYLGYVLYDSASNALGAFAIPFYYLNGDAVTNYMGQYDITHTTGETTGSTTLTLAASDNLSKGNVMLTEFAGTNGKLYGVYSGGVNSMNLVFANAYVTSFASKTYIYSNTSGNGALNFCLGYTMNQPNYGSQSWDLIGWNATVTFEVEGGDTSYYSFVRGNRK